MRLLYIVPYTPTPIRTRPYHLIRQLSRDGIEISLATLASDDMEFAALEQWRAGGINVIAEPLPRVRSVRNVASALLSAEPMQAAYCWQPSLVSRIANALETAAFDVIQVEHLRGARYGLEALERLNVLRKTIPVFWDSVDCISHLFEQTQLYSAQRTRRWITRIELERTRRFEARMTRRFAQTFVVSEPERRAFCELPGAQCERITVLPNGVALDYFAPSDIQRDAATVLMTGKMSYHANVTAALYLLDEIMPRVWQALPDARVCIAGQNPPAALTARANERIEITGYVADLRAYLNRATVACAPLLYGAGTQNKALEAMASGLAVVATPQALAALGAAPEHDLLAGQDAEEISAQLVRVITDETLRRRLEINGRRYVQAHHSWAASAEQLIRIYRRNIAD